MSKVPTLLANLVVAILIVEDDKDLRTIYKMSLQNSVQDHNLMILMAGTVPEAEELLSDYSSPIHFAILDGEVPGPGTTTELAGKIRDKHPNCFMYAASASSQHQRELMADNLCNKALDKDQVPRDIAKNLTISFPLVETA